MNYYERHLGDYAKDAGHLSMLEHGAYTLLMDRYYATEKGIPADKAHKVARARTPAEREAVDNVLSEFFVLTDGVWTKGRIEEEIAGANKRISAARENGKKGGRPPGQTQQKPSGLSLGSTPLSQDEAHQAPSPSLNTPIPPIGGMPPVAVPGSLFPAGDLPPPPAPPLPPAKPDRKAKVEVPDVDPDAIAAWQQVRMKKRAGPINSIVLAGLDRERAKVGLTRQQAVEACVEMGWQAFTAEWYQQRAGRAPGGRAPGASSHLDSKNFHEGLNDDGSIL